MPIPLIADIQNGPVTRSGLEAIAKRAWLGAAALLLVLLCAGCGGGKVNADVTVKPAFLPVALDIGPSGISIVGSRSIATPIGVFSIGASYELPSRNSDSIYVILRDRRTGFDHIYQVRTGVDQFAAVINGTTNIAINNGQVWIDITDGTIKEVSFRQVADQISVANHTGFLERVWHNGVGRWILILCGLIVIRIVRGMLFI